MSKVDEQFIEQEYNNLPLEEKRELYNLYFDSKTIQETKQRLEKILFYKKPPTVDEFLDPTNGWLSENVAAGTFDHIKQNLKEELDPVNITNLIVKYGSTRQGKSYEAVLIMLYIIIFMHHLREPAMYYGLSPLAKLCIYMISFKYDKTI